MSKKETLNELTAFLSRIPAVEVLSADAEDDFWWVKMQIDIDSPLAWNVVQELGHVLNYISLEQRLPTVFKPVSPPPYMNGGPKDFLSWVIEATDAEADPAYIAKMLEGRLPSPVDDLNEWQEDNDDDDDDSDE